MTADQVARLVESELAHVKDAETEMRMRRFLVRPHPVLRDWEYGSAHEQFTCWTVLEHTDSNTGVAYCDRGFGPKAPWGRESRAWTDA